MIFQNKVKIKKAWYASFEFFRSCLCLFLRDGEDWFEGCLDKVGLVHGAPAAVAPEAVVLVIASAVVVVVAYVLLLLLLLLLLDAVVHVELFLALQAPLEGGHL